MRNRQAPHIDFTELAGIIPSSLKALPSNLDMILERKGRFLVGEWKRKGEDISQGQKILLTELAKLPNFLVLIIQGDTDDGMNVTGFWELEADKKRLILKGCNKAELVEFVRAWYESDGFTK